VKIVKPNKKMLGLDTTTIRTTTLTITKISTKIPKN
jgi:hypothetical protein